MPRLKAQSTAEKTLLALVNKTQIEAKAPVDAPVEFKGRLPPRAISPTQLELPTLSGAEDAALTSDLQLIANARRYLIENKDVPASVPATSVLPPGTHAGNKMALDMLEVASVSLKCDELADNVISGEKWTAAGKSGAMSNPRMGAEFFPTEDGTKRTGPEEGSSIRNEPGFNVAMAGKSGAVVQPYVFVVVTDKEGTLQHGVRMYTHSTTVSQERVAEIVATELIPKDATLVLFVLFNTSNDGMHRGMTTYEDDGTDIFVIYNGTDLAPVDVAWTKTAFNPATVATLTGSGTDSFAGDFVKMANTAAKPVKERARRGKAADPDEKIRNAATKFCKAQQMAVTDELVGATVALIKERNAAMASDGAKQSTIEAAFVDAWNTSGFVASMLTGRRQPNRRFMYVAQEAAEKHAIDFNALDKKMLQIAVHYTFLNPKNRRNKFWDIEFFDEDRVDLTSIEEGVVKSFNVAEFDEAEGVEAACNIIYGEPVSGVGCVQASTLAATVSSKTLAVQAFLAGLTAHNIKEQAPNISALYFYLCQLQSPNEFGTLPDGVMPEAYHDALLSALVAVAAILVGEIPSIIVDVTLGQLVVSDRVREEVLEKARAHSWSGPIADAVRAIANIYAVKVGSKTSGLVDPSPPPSSSHQFSPAHKVGTLGAVKNIVARIAAAAYDPAVQGVSNSGAKVLALVEAVIRTEDKFAEFWSRPAKNGGFKLPSAVNVGDITGRIENPKNAARFANSSDKTALLFGLSVVMASESLEEPGSIFDVQNRIARNISRFVAFMRPSEGDELSDGDDETAPVPKKINRIVTRLMQPMLVGLQLHEDPAACIPEGTSAEDLVSAFVEMKNKPRGRRKAAISRVAPIPLSDDIVANSSSDDSSDEEEEEEVLSEGSSAGQDTRKRKRDNASRGNADKRAKNDDESSDDESVDSSGDESN